MDEELLTQTGGVIQGEFLAYSPLSKGRLNRVERNGGY